jgi:uncharacterized membrane protein
MNGDSMPRMRLLLWALLVPVTYAPLYLVGQHPGGWWWLPLLSTALAAGAVALLLRTEFFDRAALALAPRAEKILAAVAFLYVVGSTLATHARLQNFGNVSQVGLFGQSYWTLLRGHPFSNTGETLDGTLGSHLGIHFSPTLLLLAPLYALWPNPLALVAAQALVVSLAMVPLFRLLERDMGEAGAAVFSLALLAVPNLYWAGVHDFRDANFLPVLLLAAYWALENRRHVLLVIFSLAALGVREEAGAVIAMMGLYALFRAHGWRVGLGLIGLGATWIAVVIPLMSSIFWSPGLWIDAPGLWKDVLGHWGASPLEAARSMAGSPLALGQAVVNGETARYVYRLLSPMLVIPPLLDPVWIVGLPVIALNTLSRLAWMRSFGIYYSIVPATFAALAAARVAARSSLHVPLARRNAFALALGVVVLAGTLPALPLTAVQLDLPSPPPAPTRAVLGLIPHDAAVYAPLSLYPALCNRMSFGCWDCLYAEGRRWSMRGRFDWFVIWPDEFPAVADSLRDRPLADSLASDPRFEEVPGHEPFRVFRRR